MQASLEEVGAVLDDFEQRVKYDEMLKVYTYGCIYKHLQYIYVKTVRM